MRIKAITLTILFFLCSLLNGCFNYVDINNVIFVTALIIDIDEEGKPVIYVEGFHSFRSNETNSEKGERIFYTSTGETLFDAVRELNTVASYKLNYTQNKAIIFTERIARQGIKEFIDFLHRDQELLLRSYIMVYEGMKPEDLVSLKIKENEYLGLLLYEMLENPAIGSRKVHERINKYLNNRLKGQEVDLVTKIKIDEELAEKKVKVAGAAVFKDDRMVDKIDEEKVKSYHFIMNTLKGGLIIIPHPVYEDKKVVLEILQNRVKTKSEITMEGDRIILKKEITVRTTVGETQESLILDEDTLQEIIKTAENKIKADTEAFFNKYKEKGLDIFNVQDQFKIKYPKVEVENVIEATELEVKVNIYIEGSPNITSFK